MQRSKATATPIHRSLSTNKSSRRGKENDAPVPKAAQNDETLEPEQDDCGGFSSMQIDDNNDASDDEAPTQRRLKARHFTNEELDGEHNDEDVAPAGRIRRMSEREAQRHAEMQEAEARKTAKAQKAAEKERRQKEGPAPIPVKDSVFTSRHIEPRPASKNLAARDNRVPSSQARRPIIIGAAVPRGSLALSSLGDWRRPHDMSPPVVQDHRRQPASLPERPPRRDPPTRYNPDDEDFSNEDGRHPASSSPRPSSPSTGDKRPHDSDDDDDDLRPTQASKINTHHRRPRARDYDDTTQELVSAANTWFRCLIAVRDGFPDPILEKEFAREAWQKACEEFELTVSLTPDLAKIIMKRGSQLRGEIKTKARTIVELAFGFQPSQARKVIRKNRELAENLKDDYGYCYKTSPEDKENRSGIYKAPVIQRILNAALFCNKRDEGPTHPELFGPVLPKPVLALILTTIECCIDEWSTGIKTDTSFTGAEYRSLYQHHLKSMDLFEKESAPRDILGNILTRLHNIGRFNSGAQPLPQYHPVEPTLSLSAIKKAIDEYDRDSDTETDGENGED